MFTYFSGTEINMFLEKSSEVLFPYIDKKFI